MAFNHFLARPRLITGITGVVLALLSGCGGNTDEPPALAADEVRIVVSNQSDAAFSSYELLTPGLAAGEKTRWSCEVRSRCELPTLKQTSEVVKLRFYDRNDTLVTAYEIHGLSLQHKYIRTSDAMLGTQIYETLRDRYGYDTPDLSARVDHLFSRIDSLDGTPDFFEELGEHYNRQVRQGTLSEEAFYAQLNAALRNDEVLSLPLSAQRGPSLSLSLPLGAGAAESWQCTQGGGLTIDVLGSAMQEIPFIGGAVSTLLSGLIKGGCETVEDVLGRKLDNISARLAEMSARLDEIASALDSLGIRIADLSQLINDDIVRTSLIDLDDRMRTLGSYIQTYQGVIQRDTTLEAYVRNIGGLTPQNLADYRNLGTQLDAMEIRKQMDLFASITDQNRLLRLSDALKRRCSDPTTIRGDVVAERTHCLLIAASVNAKVLYLQGAATAMLADKIRTLGLAFRDAPDPESRRWLEGNFYTTPYIDDLETSRTRLIETLQQGLSNLSNAFTPNGRNALPALLDGFSHPGLLRQLVNFGCTHGDSMATSPAILEWRTTNRSPSIVVQCRDDNRLVYSQLDLIWVDFLSAATLKVMGVVSGPLNIVERNEITPRDNELVSIANSSSVDLYADPGILALTGSEKLPLKHSTNAGFYQVDMQTGLCFSSNQCEGYVVGRYTPSGQGRSISHLFGLGMATNNDKFRARMACSAYNLGTVCTPIEQGVEFNIQGVPHRITYTRNRLGQIELRKS